MFFLPPPHCSNPDQLYSVEVSGHLASSLSFLRPSLTFPPLNHHRAHRSLTASHCLLSSPGGSDGLNSVACYTEFSSFTNYFPWFLRSQKNEPTLHISVERIY